MAKYRVEFTAIPDKHNVLRGQGEIVEGEDLVDPDWMLQTGAISEYEEPKKKAEKAPDKKDDKKDDKK